MQSKRKRRRRIDEHFQDATRIPFYNRLLINGGFLLALVTIPKDLVVRALDILDRVVFGVVSRFYGFELSHV